MNYAVDDPEIPDVWCVRSGKLLTAEHVLGSEYDLAVILRSDIANGLAEAPPRVAYRCPICFVPIRLNVRHLVKRFYFVHTVEDGNCPASTKGKLDQAQIDAMRYNGLKESDMHIQMKDWICRSLAADDRFTDVASEKRWNGKLTGSFRRPDVSATFGTHRLAFEVQLSSTYVNVIAARRTFYALQGALVIWVFRHFDEGMHRMTEDDIYFTNNQNALCVTAETLQISLETGILHVECVWREPIGYGSVSDLQRKIVPIDELTLDFAKQQAYYFDYYGQVALLAAAEAEESRIIEADRLQAAAAAMSSDDHLRQKFREMWVNSRDRVSESEPPWRTIGNELRLRGLSTRRFNRFEPLGVLYSLKAGRSIGVRYGTLIEALHHALPNPKSSNASAYLQYYWRAIQVYKRKEQILSEDRTGKWMEKVEAHRLAKANGLQRPSVADKEVVKLIHFLFPELARA